MSPPTSEGSRRLGGGSAVLGALAALMLVGVRAAFFGSSATEALLSVGFLVGYVALPGIAVYRLLADPRDDALFVLGNGCALGLALQALVFVLSKVLDVPWLHHGYPVVVLVALVSMGAPRRRTSLADAAEAPGALQSALLLAIVALAILRSELAPAAEWWRPSASDPLFHAGNAAELKNNWPLMDPRVAGLALNYHFFSYALPAGASVVTGLPIAELAFRTTPAFLPALLALQVFNAGRVYGGGNAAGLLASALVLLHADLAQELGRLVGAGSDWGVASFLHRGIYASPSTVAGLVSLTTLIVVLQRWTRAPVGGEARTTACAAVAAGLSFAASGTKGSVMPVVVAGLGLALVACALSGGAWRRLVAPLCVTAFASAPVTLLLALGEGSYASSMFRVLPLWTLETSGAHVALFGERAAPLWRSVLLVLPWLALYLGLGGVAGVAALSGRCKRDAVARPSAPAEAALAAMALVGLVPALLLAAHGHSQLFFLYGGQIALVALGAAIALRWLSARNALAGLAWLAVLPLATSTARAAWTAWPRASAEATPALVDSFAEGLAWMREHLPPEAVVVAQSNVLLSVHAERRAFFETDSFTPQKHALRWNESEGEPRFVPTPGPAFPAHLLAVRRFYARGDQPSLRVLVDRVPAGSPVYALLDDARFRPDPERGRRLAIGAASELEVPWEPERAELVFSNDALRVYRLVVGDE